MSKVVKSSIEDLKCLHFLANVLALLPPHNANSAFSAVIYKCYSLLVSAGLWALCICVGKITITNRFISTNSAFFEIFIIISTVLLTHEILRAAFINFQLYSSFIQSFYRFDTFYKQCFVCFENRRRRFVELALVHVVYLSLILYDLGYRIFENRLEGYNQLVLRRIEDYFLGINSLLIYSYCKPLKDRFEKVNDYLQNAFNCPIKGYTTRLTFNNNKKEPYRLLFKVITVKKAYTQLSEMIENFNKLFGWNVVTIFSVTGLAIIGIINFQVSRELHLHRTIFLCLCISLNGIMVIVVTVICDGTTKEAKRTAVICYELLLEVPSHSEDEECRLLRKELILLARQATHQCPSFLAAGLFTVNYSSLFGLLGSITSYIIVLIQFKK